MLEIKWKHEITYLLYNYLYTYPDYTRETGSALVRSRVSFSSRNALRLYGISWIHTRGAFHSSRKCTRFPLKQKDFQGILVKTIGFKANVYEISMELFAPRPYPFWLSLEPVLNLFQSTATSFLGYVSIPCTLLIRPRMKRIRKKGLKVNE